MVGLLKDLAAGRGPRQAVLDRPGWWRRADRLFAQAVDVASACERSPLVEPRQGPASPLMVVGAGCVAAEAVAEACALRALAHVAVTVGAAAEGVEDRLRQALAAHRPWAVVSLAGARPAAASVRAVCAEAGLPMVTWDAPVARELLPGELAVHTPDLITRHDLHEFCRHVVETLEAGGGFRAAANRLAPRAYLPDAVHAVLDLLVDGRSGRVGFVAPDGLSWAELAAFVAVEAGLDAYRVEPVVVPRIGRARPRAGPEALDGRKLALPGLVDAARRAVAGWRLAAAGRASCALEGAGEGLRHAAE